MTFGNERMVVKPSKPENMANIESVPDKINRLEDMFIESSELSSVLIKNLSNKSILNLMKSSRMLLEVIQNKKEVLLNKILWIFKQRNCKEEYWQQIIQDMSDQDLQKLWQSLIEENHSKYPAVFFNGMWTPFHHAISQKSVEVFKMLLEKFKTVEWDLSLHEHPSISAFLYAVTHKLDTFIRCLIDYFGNGEKILIKETKTTKLSYYQGYVHPGRHLISQLYNDALKISVTFCYRKTTVTLIQGIQNYLIDLNEKGCPEIADEK